MLRATPNTIMTQTTAQTQIRREGELDWKPLGSFPEFAAAVGGAPAPAAGPGIPPAGARPITGPPTEKIPTYLAQSILVTICCCLPFGIVAIVHSAQVNSKISRGDYAGAIESSNKARKWGWIAFGIGIISNIIGFIFGFLNAAQSGLNP